MSLFDLQVRKIPWRRKWQPTPVLLPRKFHGWRSLVGYSPWGRKSRTQLSDFTYSLMFITMTPILKLEFSWPLNTRGLKFMDPFTHRLYFSINIRSALHIPGFHIIEGHLWDLSIQGF